MDVKQHCTTCVEFVCLGLQPTDLPTFCAVSAAISRTRVQDGFHRFLRPNTYTCGTHVRRTIRPFAAVLFPLFCCYPVRHVLTASSTNAAISASSIWVDHKHWLSCPSSCSVTKPSRGVYTAGLFLHPEAKVLANSKSRTLFWKLVCVLINHGA